MPKSLIYLQARKLKKFGNKAFLFFKELIQCHHREFLKFSRKLTPNYYQAQFKKEIEEYYFDILCEEPDTNPNTRIRLIDNSKIANPQKKNQNKELVLEITGLNHLLTEKILIEEKPEKRATERNALRVEEKKIEKAEDSSDELSSDLENIDEESSFILPEESKLVPLTSKGPVKESVVLIEELLTQTSKNKPFFYFNPVIIQFTNPSLINKDLCYLCGSFGNGDNFIFCTSCQESYHYFCISKSYNDHEKFDRIKVNNCWQCPKCKLC
jgi:hypothetical protein